MQRNRKCSLYSKKKIQAIGIESEWNQMLDSVNKNFKVAITDMFKDVKEIMSNN